MQQSLSASSSLPDVSGLTLGVHVSSPHLPHLVHHRHHEQPADASTAPATTEHTTTSAKDGGGQLQQSIDGVVSNAPLPPSMGPGVAMPPSLPAAAASAAERIADVAKKVVGLAAQVATPPPASSSSPAGSHLPGVDGASGDAPPRSRM